MKLLNSCLLRTPQLSYEQTLEESWPELKKAIQYSSDAFYQMIKDVNFADIKDLGHKAQYTIWKYFNRARYRATPYGYFGSCSVIKMDSEGCGKKIVLKKNAQIASFIDWPVKNQIQFNDQQYFDAERTYLSNGSIYHTHDCIRYIFRQEKLFEIASVDRDELIGPLLAFCKSAVSYHKIVEYLETTGGLNGYEIEDLIKELLEHQLLYTDLSPNIIGPDYFERIGVETNNEDSGYILTERKIIKGTVPEDYFRHFNECLACLSSCAEEVKASDLEVFKRDFINRFEDQEIQLLRALDPEIGVGYGNLAQPDNLDGIHELMQTNGGETVQKTGWRNMEIFLLQNMIAAGNNPNYIIQLENYKADVVGAQAKSLPNTFSALVHVVDDLVIVESIGGCTATSLLGRFTRSNPEIKEICSALVKIESDANPDVIFFDLGYLSEDQVDNVNRRDAIYEYELPILVYSCRAKPIHLGDILVRVKNEEVILYSKQYGKRLIPRLASAYNYLRSDLALYRFLCDLQQQGIKSQLNFDIAGKIPSAKYYPRIQYKNMVLSPAKWKIGFEEIKNVDCKSFLEQSGISPFFKIRNNDQTLNFDLDCEEDIRSFKQYIGQQKRDFYMEEGFMPKVPMVIDERQNPYLPQFVLSFYHTQLIYKSIAPKFSGNKPHFPISANILPGNDWLYFEIYCHPQSSNNILTEKIWPLICRHQEEITAWFFIRYLNPKHHLRLRLQIRPDADSYSILNLLSERLKSDFEDGKISDIQIKPYKREIERYGSDVMEQVERHFCTDSWFVICVLAAECTTPQIYQLLVAIGLNVLQGLKMDACEQLSLTNNYLDNFILEHQWEVREFKNLNRRYGSFKKLKAEYIALETLTGKQAELIGSFKSLLAGCAKQRQMKLYGDLFHMLINRLFTQNQRVHEGVIYYFMMKELQRQMSLAKQTEMA